jgi:hypothetical protein
MAPAIAAICGAMPAAAKMAPAKYQRIAMGKSVPAVVNAVSACLGAHETHAIEEAVGG